MKILVLKFVGLVQGTVIVGRCEETSAIGVLSKTEGERSHVFGLMDCANFVAILAPSNPSISFVSYNEDGSCEWFSGCGCAASKTCVPSTSRSGQVDDLVQSNLESLKARGDTGPSILAPNGTIVSHSHKRRRHAKILGLPFHVFVLILCFGVVIFIPAILIAFWDELSGCLQKKRDASEEEFEVEEGLLVGRKFPSRRSPSMVPVPEEEDI